MRTIFILLAMILGGCGGCASVSDIRAVTFQYKLDDGGCSGTAVGPHTILTAAHCFTGNEQSITINGRPARIVDSATDGSDHLLLRVDVAFDRWAKIGPAPEVGDVVCVNGNPGEFTNLYRCGMVSGEAKGATLYDLAGYFGDSGAGIFDSEGRLVSTVSALSSQHRLFDEGGMIQFMVSYPMEFTEEQWEQFGPQCKYKASRKQVLCE